MIRVEAGDAAYLGKNAGEVAHLLCGVDDDVLISLPTGTISQLYEGWSQLYEGWPPPDSWCPSPKMMERVRNLVSQGRIGYFIYSKSDAYGKSEMKLCAGHTGYDLGGSTLQEMFRNCLSQLSINDYFKVRVRSMDLTRLPQELRQEALPYFRSLLRSPELVVPTVPLVREKREKREYNRRTRLGDRSPYWNVRAPALRNEWWYEVDGGRALLYGDQKTGRALKSKGHWIKPCERGGVPLCGKEWMRRLLALLEVFPELPNPFRRLNNPSVIAELPDALGQDVLILLGDRELSLWPDPSP